MDNIDHGPAPPGEPIHLLHRAMSDLAFIRDAMTCSGAFTAMSGKATMALGCLAIGSAVIAAMQEKPSHWLAVWFITAILGCGLGLGAMMVKASRDGASLTRGLGKRFLLNFSPPLFAGALITPALFLRGADELLPGVWLLLYGVGMVTGGAFSVRIIPLMGLFFIGLGALGLCLAPVESFIIPAGLMAAGFGGLHIIFGAIIARQYGG